MADYNLDTVDTQGTAKGTASSIDPDNGQVVVADNVLLANGDPLDTLLAEEGKDIVIKYADQSVVSTTVLNNEIIVPNPTGSDGTATINNSNGDLLYSLVVPSGGSVIQAISDSVINIYESDGTTLIRTFNVLSQATGNATMGVNTLTANGGAFTTLEAEEDLNIEVVDVADGTTPVTTTVVGGKLNVAVTGGVYNSSLIFKTGDVNSSASGSDGALQRGRGVDYLTLDLNNGFGNTNRFTATDGTQNYATNEWVLDFSHQSQTHVMGYYRVPQAIASASLNVEMSTQPLTFGGYSDVYICNIDELWLIMKKDHTELPFNYAPFNYTVTSGIIGTTSSQIADQYFYIASNGNVTRAAGSLANQNVMYMRFFSKATLGIT